MWASRTHAAVIARVFARGRLPDAGRASDQLLAADVRDRYAEASPSPPVTKLRLSAMAAEAAMPRETVSDVPCEAVPAERREAASSMLPEVVVIVPMTEVPVMVEVVEAAKAETQRPIDRIVRVSLVSAVDPGVGSRAIIRPCRTGGKDKPDTQQERYCLGDCSAAVHCSLHYLAAGRPSLVSRWARRLTQRSGKQWCIEPPPVPKPNAMSAARNP
jgi:hypothetical protein